MDIDRAQRHFISAYVTDTRLMGVLAVYAHWHLNASDDEDDTASAWGDLHQFFYIDCEETGLETYHEVRISDPQEVEDVEQAIIGGLGAAKIDLNERELRMIMCHYRDFNEKHGLPMPEKESHYRFLFSPDMSPDKRQVRALMKKICPEIVSEHQLINYFLMRCFGRDHEGAAWLAVPKVPVALYDRYERATFFFYVIDLKEKREDGTAEYLCESLVEEDGRYDLIVSLVETKGLRVTGVSQCSAHHISDMEAALMLKKSEFVTVYEVLLSEEDLEDNLGEFSIGFHATMSECENGRLFMAFRPNNDHVDDREFLLSNDVRGIYFLSNGGQLITAAYSLEDIKRVERTVRSSILAPYLLVSERYEYKDPVLYEFMHGDIENFDAFLSLIRGE